MSYGVFRHLALTSVLLLPLGAVFADGKNGRRDHDFDGLRFQAFLSAAQEIDPTVESDARAAARVFFDPGFKRAHVFINLDRDLMVVAAHFHCALPGANGDVAFGILNPGPLTGMVTQLDRRTRVTLVNDDFTGADCVQFVGRPVNNIAALAFAMREGLIYLNLHTPTAPAGEVRGQLLEVGR
jgi:hypothetical protein